jgi:hypothetical protein
MVFSWFVLRRDGRAERAIESPRFVENEMAEPMGLAGSRR